MFRAGLNESGPFSIQPTASGVLLVPGLWPNLAMSLSITAVPSRHQSAASAGVASGLFLFIWLLVMINFASKLSIRLRITWLATNPFRRCPAVSWKLEERHSDSFYAASC